jgi:predicted TIM-barrel fold metal-dependent hydrolase
MEARADAARLLDRAARGVLRLLPPDPWLGDAHTHLGVDEDGMHLDLPTTLQQMRDWNVRRALVFPLHEADRAPAYRAPNDRVLGWAAESDGMLVPLARLDLDQSPIDEARRCLALGARGIKLHPRAQRFTVDDDRLDPVFALAAEHRLPVLIHAGRGMPPIGEHLAKVADRHPEAILILAHAAIVDQERICDLVAGHPNVFFDTSTWGVADLINLLSRVAPQQVMWATDAPYGNHLVSLALIGSILDEIGASEEIRRGIFGGTLEGIVNGVTPVMTDPIAPPTWELTHAAHRVYTYLAAATPMIWMRLPDNLGVSGLAAGACRSDDAVAELEELVTTACRLWEDVPPGATRSEVWDVAKLFQLSQIACFCPTAARRSYLCE